MSASMPVTLYLDERRFEVLRDNARRFVSGRPLRNVVDKSRWF